MRRCACKNLLGRHLALRLGPELHASLLQSRALDAASVHSQLTAPPSAPSRSSSTPDLSLHSPLAPQCLYRRQQLSPAQRPLRPHPL